MSKDIEKRVTTLESEMSELKQQLGHAETKQAAD